MPTLNRDDDCNVYTDAFRFKEFHQKYFVNADKIHTVAVIMKDIWENHALFYYLATAPNLEIGLHGWKHKDYSKLSYEECYQDLKKSLDYWKENSRRMVGYAKRIENFYAPWNREGEEIKKACQDLGLGFCAVQRGIWEGKQVKSFHWWDIIIDGWHP
jgi:peptidoglycan/xylan/chitin deacetylase (PgdA/CDA1 family)